MRSEENPLDLNNLPEDYTKDGKQVLEDSSSNAGSGAKHGKDECGKVYECRFCSLKFCKSQALGGHMNRHRQERETETLNRARQLVFNNDNTLLSQGAHLGGQPIPHGGYHQPAGNIGGDPTLQTFRSIYPTRLFSGSSSSMLPPQQGQPPSQSPYMYTSPSRLVPFQSQYPANEYFVGHVLPTANNPQTIPQQESSNYTCIGAPVGSVGHGFVANNANNIRGCEAAGGGGGLNGSGGGNSSGGREMSLYHPEEGFSWGGRTCTGTQQRLDPSSINRFQDGF